MNLRSLTGTRSKIIGSSNSDSIRNLVRQSTKATCGAFERETVVRSENVIQKKLQLRKAGFTIVGTSEANGRTRKIWFVSPGLSAL